MTDEDLEYKPSIFGQARYEPSLLGKALSKGLKKVDKINKTV